MTSKERVMNCLEFKPVDRLPVDVWILPAARMEYGEKLDEILKKYDTDIRTFVGPFDHGYTPEYYEIGKFMDPWGSEWTNLQAGVIGEVKNPVFDDYDKLEGYQSPKPEFEKQWAEKKDSIAEQIKGARAENKFVIGGWISLFERLQYLRGTEDVYCDIALEEEEMFDMIEIVMDFMRTYVKSWLEMDIDAMAFGDDWGSQKSTLISPDSWRKIFKPLYKELIDMIKAAGKKVFFHSDGYILELYPEFIDMGVNAINSQIWCMGVEKVAEACKGKIVNWGEISRQDILPKGSVQDVYDAANKMKELLVLDNGSGLIGQSELNRDVSLENIEAFFNAWK